jgi:autotransporter-associated beta strand protein
VQSGSGTTTLSGTNTYTGGTTVNSGTLQAGSTSAFGTLSAVTVNGSATLDLNNFSNTVGTLNGLTTTSYITLGTGTLTIGTAAANSTYDGTISGGGGLTLNNVDGYTLTLAGNNTYTGATAVTNGTLLALNTAGSAVGTGPITIGSGAVLQVGSITTTGAIGTANIADNGTLTFARTDSISIPNVISGFGGVTVDRGTVTLTGNNTYTGVTSIFNSTVDAGSATALGNHSTVDLSTNGILNLTTFNVTVGNISSPGDTSTTVNLGANTLTLGNAVSNQTFAGAITGTGALDVISTIDMTSNLNTYSGGTTIAGGTFIADNTSGSATGTGAVTISGGGTLIIGNDSTTGFITNLPITDNGLVDFQRTNAVTFPNAITGTGSVEAQDGGTITLTGTNTYSGFTNVTGGLTGTSLVAGSTNAFGNGTSAVSLAPGASTGTLNLNGFNNAIGSVVGNTNTFIVLGSATLTDGAAGGTNIYGGVISGTGGLNVVSPGNVVLTGANTYSGPTSIASGGRLELGFGGTTGSIANSSGVSGAGTLQYDLTNATTYAGAISGAISVTQSGTGTTILTGANTYTGLTSVNSGTLSDSGATSFSPASQMLVNTSGTLLVNSNEVVANLQNGASGGHVAIASGATLTSNGANYVSDFNGVISGAGSFVINGGTQGLSGANTLTGGVTLESGELYIGGNSAFGSGTLTLDAGTNIAPEANATLSNPVVLSGSGYVINNWGPSGLTLTGTVSGTGEFSWCTTNTLTLTGSNTFTSGIDMREGTLLLGNDQAAGIGGTIILDLGTYLDAAGSGVTRNIANPIYVSNTATQIGEGNDNVLTLSGAISGTGITSVVTIDNGLSGSVTLSGTNTISNTTFDVNNGGTVFAATGSAFGATTNPVVLQGGSTLNVLGSITIANPITAGTGANTLAGNGTITNNSSALAITNSVILSPSASPGGGPGNLTFTAPLIFTGGAIHFQLYNATGAPGTGWGEITASGGMNFAAATANSITFNVVSVNSTGGSAAALNFNPGSSYVWTFATSPSITSFNAADFNIITSGFTNGTGGGGFSVSQVGNNLNLDFTPVPEPSTWALMASGILALATFEIRRRRPARA